METNQDRTAKPVVLVTGSSGYLGAAVTRRLSEKYTVVGLDRFTPPHPPHLAECVCFDITDQQSVDKALKRIRHAYGDKIASCVHLAAYFDLTGEENSAYEAVTVEGTKRLLKGLQEFDLEQFVFASTMLAHAPTEPGRPISEDDPLDPKLPYRASKVRTEAMLREEKTDEKHVLLRPAASTTTKDIRLSSPIRLPGSTKSGSAARYIQAICSGGRSFCILTIYLTRSSVLSTGAPICRTPFPCCWARPSRSPLANYSA